VCRQKSREIAWKAQNRLHKRYMKMAMAGKEQRKIITAIGRELLGFIWAIGIKAEAAPHATNCSMTRTEHTKAKAFQIMKKQERFRQ
jgi:hypothetical protein